MVGRRQRSVIARWRVLSLAALLVGAGCAGSDRGPTASDAIGGEPSTPVDGSTSGAGPLDAPAAELIDEVLAMTEADRDAALVEAGLDMELAAAKESGLEAELGGPEATREALVSAWAPLVELARGTEAAIPPLGLRRGTAGPPSLGEGLFGGFLVVGLGSGAAASASADRGSDAPASESSNGFTITGSKNNGELAAELTHTDAATGVTTKLKAKVVMMPCPDVDGRFEAHVTLDVIASKGGASQRGVLRVDIVGYADDDANLASSEAEYDLTWSKGGGGSADALIEVAGTSAGRSKIRHRSGDSSDLDASASVGAGLYAILIETSTASAAQTAWQSGQCVRLDVTSQPGPKEVKPGGTAEVDAAPRSKIDGGPVGGTVVATLEGVRAIEPFGSPLPADATFVYTAPGTDERLPNFGKVMLEARSRRGVAKASITFEIDRVAYVASGGGAEISIGGTVKDVDSFTLTGQFAGGSATFDFSSDLDDEGFRLPSGTYTVAGGGSGATVTGNGTYTLTANDDGTLALTMQTHACVDVSGQCRDTTETVTLTPQT